MHRHLHGGAPCPALGGILRSINPRLSRTAIRDRIRASGSHYAAQTAALGSGLPNARTAGDADHRPDAQQAGAAVFDV